MMLGLLSLFGDVSGQCSNSFLFLTPWYQYLTLRPYPDCSVYFPNGNGLITASNWNEIWLIGIALLDDLLKIAGAAAVVFIIYGGFRYLTSQGNPENTKAAWGTIFNALIGLIIAGVSITAVNYLGNQLGGTATNNGLPVIVADSTTVTTILNIVFSIMGAVSVIMVLFGSFKYVISRGEPQATAQAKDTILYALIGVAVATLAFSIVNFVLYKIG